MDVILKFRNYGHGGAWYYMLVETFPCPVDAYTYAGIMQNIDGRDDRLYITRAKV